MHQFPLDEPTWLARVSPGAVENEVSFIINYLTSVVNNINSDHILLDFRLPRIDRVF